MRRSVKRQDPTPLYLDVLSLVLGGVPCVIGSIFLFGGSDSIFDIPFEYWTLFWVVLTVWGVLATITGVLFKSKVGIVLGTISTVFSMLFSIGAFIFNAMEMSSKMMCYQQMQTLSSTVQQYCEQNEGTLPDADKWCDQLMGSTEDEDQKAILEFVLEGHAFPDSKGEKTSRFAINNYLDGYKISEIDRQTVLLFETDSGWNQNGTLTTLPAKRHPGFQPFFEGGYHFVLIGPDSTFAVEFVKDSELDSLNWTVKNSPDDKNEDN